ncbi:MAG TPA: response regulator [Allosphingosinicella sp.]|nr:response regulator [Allosphingosinicella sp.]
MRRWSRLTAVDVLTDAGFETLEAGDAEEALQLLEQHPEVDVLFTDVNMPGQIDGIALACRAHRARPQLALVVTSGKQRIPDAELPDHGVFLPKPYGASELVRVVTTQLYRRG